MPHIVLDKSLNLFDFSILFKPLFQKSPLIKIQDMFIDTRGSNALLSTVVIDNSHHEFFIQLMTSKDKTTIRLYPLTDPEKTNAVKQSLANVCLEIQKHYPDMKVIKSNLWDYITKDIIQ
jgi:hypothetical protein